MTTPCLSIIAPIYNEESTIPALYQRLTSVLDGLRVTYELVFINDGSHDRSLDLLRDLAQTDTRVRVVDFSRNFGHQIAITAGMDLATGDAVVIIDADLQDPPELIADMLEKWKEGYDVVYAVREKRQGDTFFKQATAALFYRLLKRITSIDIPVDTGDFRLMSRRTVEGMKLFRERNRFVRGLVSWVGFNQTGIPFIRDERYSGETKYPLKKMLKFALDGLVSFSFIPLQLATYFGFLVSGLSFLGIVWVLYLRWFTQETITGWTSLMVMVLFLGGIQLLTLGVLGEYVGRIYDEVKRRPLYLVKEWIGFGTSHHAHDRASSEDDPRQQPS